MSVPLFLVRVRPSFPAPIFALRFSFYATSCTRVTLKSPLFCSNILLLFLVSSALVMAPCAFSDGPKKINLSLLTGFGKIFASRQLAAKLEPSSLNMKKFCNLVVQGETDPSRKIMERLEAKMKRRSKGSSISIFTIKDHPF